jgi:hypothetical protein
MAPPGHFVALTGTSYQEATVDPTTIIIFLSATFTAAILAVVSIGCLVVNFTQSSRSRNANDYSAAVLARIQR